MNRKLADRSFVMQRYDINSNAYINAYSRLKINYAIATWWRFTFHTKEKHKK